MNESRRRLVELLAAAASGGSIGAAAAINSVATPLLRRPQVADPAVRQRYVDTSLGQVHYWTAGRGPHLLLIHQSGNSGDEFAGLLKYLANDFTLIAPDLPGHGSSDDPPRAPEVADYGNAVIAVLDDLKVERCHLLGHHGGAMVAMFVAAARPTAIDRVVLSGTSGLKSSSEAEAFAQSLQRPPTVIDPSGDWILETWRSYVAMMSPGADLASTFQPFLANLQGRLRPYRAIDTYMRWDRREALQSIRRPVLLLQGDADKYVSKQEQLLEVLPDARRHVMKDCGAFVFYEKPAECAALIRPFLLG